MSTEKNLYRLNELSDYKVASHYSDVRGWELIDAEGREIGKIDNLLVNKRAEKVVYLDVEVNEDLIKEGHETYAKSAGEGVHEYLNKDGEDHLIVPIGAVAIDNENKKVISNTINFDTFTRSSRVGRGENIGRDYEVEVLAVYYPGEEDTTINEDEFYNRDYFKRRD